MRSLLMLVLLFLVGCLDRKTGADLQQDGNAAKLDREFVEEDMTQQFTKLRTSFLKITNRDQVNGFFEELETMVNAPDAEPDVKFTGSLLLIIRPLEAMTFRGAELIRSNKNVHSLLLSHVMGQAVLRRNYYPTPQGEAFFRFLTEPVNDDRAQQGIVMPIRTMEDVQFVLGQVLQRLEFAYGAIKDIDVNGNRLLFDQKIAYGSGGFSDGISRFYQIGEAEKEATLASLKMSIHGIQVFNSYNLHDLPTIIYKLGKTMGMDGFSLLVDNDINGFPSCRRAQIIKKDHPGFWQRLPHGEALMKAAFGSLTEAVKHANAAWESVKSRDTNNNPAELTTFDHFFYAPARQSLHALPNKRAIENLTAMLAGRKEMHSPISGETAVVDLPAFYNKSPENLNKLLPTSFVDDCSDERTARYDKTKSGREYRDYLWGSPKTWDGYQDYFPGETDIPKVSRVLVQSWGGWLGTPLVAMVN